MADEKQLISGFGRRYNLPENLHIEYEGLCGNIVNQVVVKMVEKYDGFVADQIAMEARASGVSDLTVLNKTAIMNALKKEIPQQVIINDNECLCPACRYDMMGLWDYPDVQDPNYCPICGQKLKWRTNDDKGTADTDLL